MYNSETMPTILDRSHKTKKSVSVKTRPKALSLFSGAGGLDIGVMQAGFDILASVGYTIGYFDEESRKFSPNDDPFGLHFS